MFKTITVFRLNDHKTRVCLSATSLGLALPEPTAGDPGSFEWSKGGFSKPDNFGASPVFVGASDSHVLNFQLRERILPAKVIRQTLTRQIEAAAKRQGHPVSRKQVAELKEEVIMALLPTAFIRPVDVPVMFVKNYLLIGASSARMVDLVLSALRSLFPQEVLTVKSVVKDRNPQKWMTELLLEGSTLSGSFNLGTAVVLRGTDRRTARFKDMNLEGSAEIRKFVTDGCKPVEIAVEYNDRISFALSDQIVLKRIKFSDILLKQSEEDAGDADATAQFDATVALVGGELLALLADMLIEMPEDEDEL